MYHPVCLYLHLMWVFEQVGVVVERSLDGVHHYLAEAYLNRAVECPQWVLLHPQAEVFPHYYHCHLHRLVGGLGLTLRVGGAVVLKKRMRMGRVLMRRRIMVGVVQVVGIEGFVLVLLPVF